MMNKPANTTLHLTLVNAAKISAIFVLVSHSKSMLASWAAGELSRSMATKSHTHSAICYLIEPFESCTVGVT